MLCLLDGDIITYRCGFTTEDVDQGIAYSRLRKMVDGILIKVEATSYKVFLTAENDPTAFRRKIYPEYKAHRLQAKPKWHQELRNYLQAEYNADVCTEIEADDAMGICQTDASIICSVDKDLKQIPGAHYNFVKDEFSEVTKFEGLKNFYMQLLTGDSADNIRGLWKVGPKKAEAALAGLTTEQEMFNKVRKMYGNDDEMEMNGRVLYIWKKPQDDWINYWQVLSSTSS